MAFTINRPSNEKSLNIQKQLPTESTPVNEEGYLSRGVRNIVRSGARLAESVAGLPGAALQMVQIPVTGIAKTGKYALEKITGHQLPEVMQPKILPTPSDIKTHVTERLTGEYLKPKGKIEEALDLTVSNLPFIYSFGSTPLLQKIGTDFAGSLAMKGAEEFGLGIGGQLIAGMLGTGTANKAVNFIKKGGNPNSLLNLAKAKESELAQKAEQLGEKATIDSKDYITKLKKLEKRIPNNKGLDIEDKKNLMAKINDFYADIKNGKISGAKLDASNKQINSNFAYTQRKGGEYKNIISSLQNDVIKDTEKQIGEKHKDWYDAVTGYRNITKAMNFGSTFTDVISEHPKLIKLVSSPILQGILGIGTGAKFAGQLGALGGAASVAIGTKAMEVLPFLTQGSETRKLFSNVIKYTLEENIPQLTKNLKLLNTEAEKFEDKKKSGDIYKNKSSFSIVRQNNNTQSVK